MREKELFYTIVSTALETFNGRQQFSPGMFEPLKPLFAKLGFDNAAIYITDDFPDGMHRVTHLGDPLIFPENVVMRDRKSLADALAVEIAGIPGAMVQSLHSHGRELGAIAATCPRGGVDSRDALDILARTLSAMGYVERIRTNSYRERQERDVFFAQSLTNRLLVRENPKVKGLRIGHEFVRSLEAGGDFFDMVHRRDGSLVGYVGCCNGHGLRTVLEVCGIMRRINRALLAGHPLSEVMLGVNDYLVRVKRRAHQASLCLFNIDMAKRRISLAKAGRMDIVLFDKKAESNNLSSRSGIFLGMIPKPNIVEETHPFAPGSSFFCVTEGLHSDKNSMKSAPHTAWFYRALADTVTEKPTVPLVNALFKKMGSRPLGALLAVSIEFRNPPTAKR